MMPATFALPLGRDLNRHIQDRLKNLSPFNEPSQVPQLTTVQLAAMIDHTQLKPEADRAMIEQLCQEAVHYGFASVCVNPFNVPYCAEMLRGSQVAVCTVTVSRLVRLRRASKWLKPGLESGRELPRSTWLSM